MTTISVSALQRQQSSLTRLNHDAHFLRLHGITKQLKIRILKLNLEKQFSPNEANKLLLHAFGITREIKIKIFDLNQTENLMQSQSELSKNATKSKNSLVKQYKCHLCNKTYNLNGNLTRHLKVSHKVNRETYSCSYSNCQYQGVSVLATKNHLAKVHMEIPFKCSSCNLCFKSNEGLQGHLKTHSEAKQFKCEYKGCFYQNHFKGNFKSHLKTHLSRDQDKSDLFQCDFKFCKKSFYYQASLKRHVLSIHTPEQIKKKQKCAFCNYDTPFKSCLEVHMRVHTREKPFKCKFCKYSSSEPSGLKRHLRTHTGERLHSCSICERKFIASFDLKNHMRIHTGEKPYSCRQCDYKAAKQQYLKSHIAAKHKCKD